MAEELRQALAELVRLTDRNPEAKEAPRDAG